MTSMAKIKRNEIADFWDNAVNDWLGSTSDQDWLRRLRSKGSNDPLLRWFNSYNGQIDLNHGIESFSGDLRGKQNEPRLVVLGLNPGIAYDAILSRSGVWHQNIIQSGGYSFCFKRSPPADPDVWIALHGKTSAYWDRLIKFAQRWLRDPRADHNVILNFELYPWHSKSVTAGIDTPPDLAEHYIFEPIAEINVPQVFAFGAPWFEVGERLAARNKLKTIRTPYMVQGDSDTSRWTVGLYELPSTQRLVVSSQSGFAGPPGEGRMEAFRRASGSAP
jgi:hypothetical protein